MIVFLLILLIKTDDKVLKNRFWYKKSSFKLNNLAIDKVKKDWIINMNRKAPSPIRRQLFAGIILAFIGWITIHYSYVYNLLLKNYIIFKNIGMLFIIIGVIVRVFAFLQIKNTHYINKLIISGIYSKIRNPIYLAFILIIWGIAIYSRGLLSLIWVMISILVLYLVAKLEEKDLEELFGYEYIKYKSEVPMFIPKFWRK